MNKEQESFLRILSDHLNHRKSEACPELAWDTLLGYAQIHQVGGIVYRQCAAFLPAREKALLRERHDAELFYYCNRKALLDKIEKALSEAQIPFFCVKGLEVARLYPVPALRTMGDCDIVVHPEDQERAHPVLCSLGFTLRKKDLAEWVYGKNNIQVEIHSHLLYNEVANTAAERAFFDAAWDYARPTGEGTCCELEWSVHFLFLLIHLKKHLIQSGVGFRQFMDLSVVLQNCELNWPFIEARLEQFGLRKYAGVVLALVERWFAVTSPLADPKLEEAFYSEAAERLFANGVFGYDDEGNRDNARMRSISNGKKGLFARLRYLRSVCFLPYEALRVVPEYRFLDGRPWLLPLAWLYRLIYKLRKNRGAAGAQMLKAAFVSDEALSARELDLAKWGL